MTRTANLELPYILASQAQKHVTHNQALRRLDAIVQMSVLGNLPEPPGSPVEGDRYIVAADAEGEWIAREDSVAVFQDGAWDFLQPQKGWLAWVVDAGKLIVFDGLNWVSAVHPDLLNVPMIGVNTSADLTNRLSVRSDATLFDHDGTDHRLKLNRSSLSDVATVLFQTSYEGNAEIGLQGDGYLSAKVSSDGATWTTALAITANGRVTLPGALALSDPNQIACMRHVRTALTANRTYYVRPDGNDANDGLSDIAAGAFATVGRALAAAFGEVDLRGHDITIHLADATYAESVAVRGPQVGTGTITLSGNATAPQNTILSGAAGVRTIELTNGAALAIRDFEIRGNGTSATFVAKGASLTVGSGMRFGSAVTAQLYAQDNGVIDATGASYSIVGGSARHLLAVTGSAINALNCIVTIAGSPVFSTAYAQANRASVINANGSAFSGSATGKRYDVATNGVINTTGAGVSFLPGDAAGTATTGGLYA